MWNSLKKNRIGIFFLIVILESLASNFAHSVTPTLIQNLHLHDYMFGVAFSGMAFTNFLFSPFWGKISRMYSSRKVLCVGCIGYAIGQIFFSQSTTEAGIFLARCLSGAFVGAIMVCFLTYVINVSDEEDRGRNLAICSTLTTVGSAFGYLIGGLLGEISVSLDFYVQSASLTVSGILFLVCLKNDSAEKPVGQKQSVGGFLREANPFSAFLEARHFMTKTFLILFLVVFIANCGTNAYDQCFNYYIKDQFGFTSAYNGLIKAVVGLMALVSNLTVCMWLLKKTRVPRSTAIVLSLCSAAMLGVVLIEQIVPFILVNLLFYGVNAIYIPLLQDCVAKRGNNENSNMVMGFYNAMRSLGMIGGALSAGFIYGYMPKAPFLMAFILFAAAALLQVIYCRGWYGSAKKTPENL